MPDQPLIINTDRGLYCPLGDFYVDAWHPVPRSVVTHAHADHARQGCDRYLTAADGQHVLQHRMGPNAIIDTLPYGEPLTINNVRVSLHPAGHLLGSSQVRIEHRGETWVITGDYKRQPDPTCQPFEIVRCNTLVTECTFGLPIFRWKNSALIAAEINTWWGGNIAEGRTSVLLAYSLGKAQRILASVDRSIGPILLHGAVHAMTEQYRASNVPLPPAEYASPENAKLHRGKALLICPPAAAGSTWLRKFAPVSVAVASGWMQVRGFRRRAAADRGFVLSDHVDWPALLQTIDESGADHLIATHGYTEQLTRYLAERGKNTAIFQTRFSAGDDEADGETPAAPSAEAN